MPVSSYLIRIEVCELANIAAIRQNVLIVGDVPNSNRISSGVLALVALICDDLSVPIAERIGQAVFARIPKDEIHSSIKPENRIRLINSIGTGRVNIVQPEGEGV
jgi:hypothetical protein